MPTDKPNKAGSGKKKRGAPKRYRCPVIRVTLCIPQDGKAELIQSAEKIAAKYLRKGQQARPRVRSGKVGQNGTNEATQPQATCTDKNENRVCPPLLSGPNENPEIGVLLSEAEENSKNGSALPN